MSTDEPWRPPPTPDTPPPPRIILPHVYGMLRPATAAWAAECGYRVELVAIDPGDLYAYGHLMEHLWDGSSTLIVVEHDIIPPPDAMLGFHNCDRPWCTHGYPIQGVTYFHGLGCTRFSAQLQRDHPHLMANAAGNYLGRRVRTPWPVLDSMIRRELDIRHMPVHVHGPEAVHLHDYGQA